MPIWGRKGNSFACLDRRARPAERRLGVAAGPLVRVVELGHAREWAGACVWRLARAERARLVHAGLDR